MSEKYEIIREGIKSLLICEMDEIEKDVPVYTERLKIHGLLSGTRRFRDGKEYLVYDISGKRSLSEAYENRSMTASDMKELLLAIMMLRNSLYEYLLPEDALILDPERIYMSSDMSEYFFVFEEQTQEEFVIGLRALSEFLITHAQHEDGSAVAIAYRFFSDASCECMNIKEILDMSNKEKVEEKREENITIKEEDNSSNKQKSNIKTVREKVFNTKNKKKGDVDGKSPKQNTLIINILTIIPLVLLLGAYVSFPAKQNIIMAVILVYFVGFAVYLIGKKRKKKEAL